MGEQTRLQAVRLLRDEFGAWAIGDDRDRDEAVESADLATLQDLVDAVRQLPDEVWDWLAGPEAASPSPSADYVEVSNITMAADLARVVLSQLN